MLTIAEIGVDQLIVDEAQEFRKLSLRDQHDHAERRRAGRLAAGVGPLRQIPLHRTTSNPGRALILASGTPITNTLGEMFTLQRFMQPDALEERGLHEFDAWAATFGDTGPSWSCSRPATTSRSPASAEFVNVADLIAMFRSVADVVLKDDLRAYLSLPRDRGPASARSSPPRRAPPSRPTRRCSRGASS